MPKRKAREPEIIGHAFNDPRSGGPFRVALGDTLYWVCCDCALRHLTSVERSPFSKDEVLIRQWRDNHGTDAMRKLEGIRVQRRKKGRIRGEAR